VERVTETIKQIANEHTVTNKGGEMYTLPELLQRRSVFDDLLGDSSTR
jgi:hypothetical protein